MISFMRAADATRRERSLCRIGRRTCADCADVLRCLTSSDRRRRYVQQRTEEADAFDRIVEVAVAEAEDGVFVSAEAVHAWFDALETDPNTPPPEPDIFLKQG
jgi:hypothetical protein